jgi:transglutaminase-like putative cysteine protease
MRSLLLVPLAALSMSGSGPKSGVFDARHELKVTVPEGAKSVRIWFTMPQQVPEQKIDGFKIDCALPHRVTTDDHGNQAVFVEVKDPKVKEIAILETFRVTRQEVIGDVDPSHAKPLTDEDRKKFAADLAENANVKITDEMRRLSKQIVGDETNPVKAARKLYDWTLDNIEYWVKDPANKKASPVGSSEYCLSSKTGNCTDFHSLWAALARASGIPTRIIYGSIFKPDLAGQDKDASYHCWPQFYANGIGWISHDVAVADIFHGTFPLNADNTEKVKLTTASGYTAPDEKLVNYYFGNLDERRVVWSTGRDLKLDPPQAGGPVNALAKAYVEIDGAAVGEKSADGKTVNWTRKMTYTVPGAGN